jgi:hypothetical protein
MAGMDRGMEELTERRLASVLEVAALHGTALDLEDAAALLPDSAPRNPEELRAWIRENPRRGSIVGATIAAPSASLPSPSEVVSRRERGEAYWLQARELLDGPFGLTTPLLRSVAVTGSAAYREPEEGDDLDLMAVTQRGTVWLFLLLAFVRLRRVRQRSSSRPTPWCLNYVVDDRRAAHEYSRAQGFLFAREALSARVLHGAAFYRDLLLAAPWMADELPRLYRRALASEPRADAAPPTASRLDRVVSALIFPFLATYLQLRGLVRNHQLRRTGRTEESFRTVTSFDRFTLMTRRFELLSGLYGSPSISPAREATA